jgi:hypothetical protein
LPWKLQPSYDGTNMGKKGGRPSLDTPTVSDAELKAAREALKSRDEGRRANSNMMYYLKSSGSKVMYDHMSASDKRDFFIKWFAKKLSEGTTKSSSSQQALLVSETGNEHEWMGKERMISALGEQKTLAKIASNVLATRPDPDTGKNGEFDIEYKVIFGKGKKVESELISHTLRTESEVQEADNTTAMEDIAAASTAAGDACSLAVDIKVEPASKAASSPREPDEATHQKTFDALQKNPRQVLRACGDTIINIKQMFEATQGGKYTEVLNTDLGKILPKFKSHFTSIEILVTRAPKADNDDDAEAVLLAIAKKLDNDYAKYNDFTEWYGKLFAGKQPKKAKR